MPEIAPLLRVINDELNAFTVPETPKELYEPITYTLANGGKRMRPLLVLLGCKLFSEDVSQALKPAIGMEIFHNFTLLHDDIMDNAPLRRGKDTVHRKWDSNVAILSGDTMLIKAYEQVIQTRLEVLPHVLREFNRTATLVCEGQQLDMNFESRTDVSIEEYLGMIELKTSVLLATCLKVGAMIGGAAEVDAQHLYNFGRDIGIAFQLQDDILDVYGESDKVGKQRGGDILSNKKTYLLLRAKELATGSDSKELAHWLTEMNHDPSEKVAAVIALYNRLGVRQVAEKRMWSYFENGLAELEKVNGDAVWKAALQSFATDLMHREH